MRKQLALVAVGFLAASAPVPANDLCGVDGVAVLATNSAHFDRDAEITGDVVVNLASTDPDLPEDAELSFDRDSTINGSCAGDSVDLDKGTSVSGDVLFNELDKAGNVTIGGSEITPLTLPVLSVLPPFQTGSPSAVDVVVGRDLTVEIGDVGGVFGRRDFGDIVIERGGTLLLSGGGSFDAESLSAKRDATILFDAPTDLRIAGTVDADKNLVLGPQGSGSASGIVLYVAGFDISSNDDSDSDSDSDSDAKWAVDVDRNATIAANVYAPNGTIRLDQKAHVTGALLARDVDVDKDADVFVDSAFSNAPPVAIAQEVITDGANALAITLEGGDPEGGDLDFSIEVDPTEGTLGAITPVVPAPINLCSQSGGSCSVDADCPFFAGGETCETVQPPITQAVVTYTPVAANCTTEPTSGEVTCPEDFFTFGVSDACGALGTAIVSINGGTDEVPDDPGPGAETVETEDVELDAIVNEVKVITLSAAAPGTVSAVTFRVESLPAGAIEDEFGSPITVAGTDLPSPVVVYQAPATAGADSFTFSARDSSTSAPPCGPPSCDSGAVNIDVGTLPELAPGQSATTDLNTPVEVTLLANAGGSGDGGGQQAFAGGLHALAAEVEVTEDNGTLSAWQLGRVAARRRAADGPRPGTRVGANGPTVLTVDGGWSQFGWCDAVTSPGCNDLVDLVNEVEVLESPFDFTTTEASCLRVTDTLAKGDHWRVEATFGGSLDWTDFTSEVEQSTVGTTSDPNTAFGDLTYSHGAFDLTGAGSYSVKLTTIPPDSFAFGTAGYVRIDTGPCIDVVWTLTSLPDNGTLTFNGVPAQVGQTWVTEPTLVYTPTFNYTGPDSFGYNVTQNGTLGINTVVDSAIVDLFVNPDDPCVLVGREPGCAPGGVPQAMLAGSAAAAARPEPDLGPANGLTVAIEGNGGTVTAVPVVAQVRGRTIPRLICSNGECHKALPAGETVTLYARPDGDHFEFLGWGGHCRGIEPILEIVLDATTRCTARFGSKPVDE